MGVKVTNNGFGTLSAGINSSATTVTVDSGQGARFPALSSGDFFFATLIDTSNNLEIIKVTARSTDSMTVTRAQDNTSARAFSIGDRIELRPTAALFETVLSEAIAGATPASNSITTAMLQDDLVTNAKIGAAAVNTTELGTGIDLTGKIATGHETLSSHVVARSFSAVGYTTGSANVTLGYLDIPGPGIWRYEAQLRIRWAGNAYFQKTFLSTTDNSLTGEIYRSGGGANTAVRMLLERVSVNSFGNLLLTPSWIIDVPTGLTSGDRVYLIIQPSAGDSLALNNNDANGQPGAHAIKIAETTTSGTTITARSF